MHYGIKVLADQHYLVSRETSVLTAAISVEGA